MSFSSMVGPAEKVEFYGHPIVYIAPTVYGHPHVSNLPAVPRFNADPLHVLINLYENCIGPDCALPELQ
jgi:hypothetical protein